MPSLLQIAQELTLCLASDVTPLLLGERGIGKSSIVRELAFDTAPEFARLREELWGSGEPVGFINLRGSLHEAADFTGLPFIPGSNGNGSGNGDDITVTDFAPPTILPHDWLQGERGLLLLDEIFRAQADVQQAIFQLIEHQVAPDGGFYHQCSRYVLPAGWDVVAASNPPRGRSYSQNALLDAAFMDRFVQLGVEVDEAYLQGWVQYMSRLGNGMEQSEVERVLAYTAQRDVGAMFLGQQNQLATREQDEMTVEDGGDIHPSPRTWEAVVRVNTVARRLGIYGEAAHRRVLAGMLGLGLVSDFLNTEPGIGARRVLDHDRQEWEEEVLGLSRELTRNLVWTLTGMLPEITAKVHRNRVLDCIDVLLHDKAKPDNWDLTVSLALTAAREGARELGITHTWSNAAIAGPQLLESLLKTVRKADGLEPPGANWLVLMMDRPELALKMGRLVAGQAPRG